jgi:spore coat protein U-like protein
MRKTKLLFAAAAAAFSAPALAGPSDDMIITANIANACQISADDVSVDMTNIRTGLSQSGSVNIWCTNGHAVQVTATSANSFSLVSGANSISYSLTSGGGAFTNVPFTGNASATMSQIPYTLTFPGQNPAAGTYTDTVTFTIAP